LTVRSRPSGAQVRLGTRVLGQTPLEAASVACAPAAVTVAHPRYQTAETKVDLRPGTPGDLMVKLERPRAELRIDSTPPRALIKINGKPVGQAPRTVSVQRFEQVQVEATLPGAKPFRQRVYVAEPVTKVNAALSGPSPRRGR
jgi:hypothetical protein